MTDAMRVARAATVRLVAGWVFVLFLPIIGLSWSEPSGASTRFGRHFPHGSDAVAYLYGPSGTWREQTNVYYGWNFYKHCETAGHPFDPEALVRESAAANSTAPDADCLILGDFDNDGEVADDLAGGFAFHEHAGRGVLGEQTGGPFYQFWFDDNWLARYVAEAYDRPLPSGLHDAGHSIRWRVLGGDNRHRKPYPSSSQYIDQLGLNGIYKLNGGDLAGAMADWRRILDASGARYDAARRRFDYSFAAESVYYYGLWAILSEQLLAAAPRFAARDEVLQHAMSLRSWLITLQEKDAAGQRLGWRTGTVPAALINTETTAVSVLALGASASWVFEPGHNPLVSGAGHYTLEDGVLSATAGASVPGHVVHGPYWTLAPGLYAVEFSLRTKAPRVDGSLVTVDVFDGRSVLQSLTIEGAAAPSFDRWQRYRLIAYLQDPANVTEFRVFWHGSYDVDVGPIRVSPALNQLRTLARGAAPLDVKRSTPIETIDSSRTRVPCRASKGCATPNAPLVRRTSRF